MSQRRLLLVGAVWTAVAVILPLCSPWLGPFPSIVALTFLFPAWLALGGVALVAAAWRGRTAPRQVGAATVVWFFAASELFFQRDRLISVGEDWYFHAHRASYEESIRGLPDPPTNLILEDGLVRVDPGPPVRVGFPWSGWLGDWRGVVYDPSEQLGLWPPDPHLRLFGRQMRGCRRLGPRWFLCDTVD